MQPKQKKDGIRGCERSQERGITPNGVSRGGNKKIFLEVLVVLVAKSHLTLGTPWTVAHQVPLSMGFSKQEYWSQLPFPSPGDLPSPGIEPASHALQADSLLTEPQRKPFL